MVTIPPDVVRTRASSTVLVKASSLVNRDLAGITAGYRCRVGEFVGSWCEALMQKAIGVETSGVEGVAERCLETWS